jgi:drug/metabolite transporter (DMT)-like permease
MTITATSVIVDTPRPIALGYLAALAVVLISAVYPAITRVSVTTTLTPGDLLMLRFGISGLVFLPYLIWRRAEVPRSLWYVAIPLSFLNGWGMAGCAIIGLQFAPASHAVALGPGSISVWVAVLAGIAYGRKIDRAKALSISIIFIGIVIILAMSLGGLSLADALTGDALFVAASLLSAAYLIYVQQVRLDPGLGVALVSISSALILLPWYLLAAPSTLVSAPLSEIAFQSVLQGFLVGCIVYFAIGYAVACVGSQTFGVLLALVPVVGVVASAAIGGDPVSPFEWVAIATISLGVAIGARPNPALQSR